MITTKQTPYIAPKVKAVSFIVESGFAGSSGEISSESDESFQNMSRSEDPNAHIDNTYF